MLVRLACSVLPGVFQHARGVGVRVWEGVSVGARVAVRVGDGEWVAVGIKGVSVGRTAGAEGGWVFCEEI